MLDAVDLQNDELVLDIGSGFGYSAAIIAHIAEAVVAAESDTAMSEESQAALSDLGADNVIAHAGDLALGVAEHGPYDVIIIEGGVETVPDSVLDQLKIGGRIGVIKMTGALGQCMIGHKTATGVDWRWEFDAAAPVLPGFEAPAAFNFD